MNRRDKSALVFVLIMTIFLLGYKFSSNYMMDYESAYLRQTTIPLSPEMSTGFDPPIISQEVLDLFSNKAPAIPLQYTNLIDIEEYERGDAHENSYIPFFWHVSRNAGTTLKSLLGECLGLTLASAFQIPIDSLFVSNEPRIIRSDDVKYLNVNLQTREGIARAKQMDIIHEIETDHGPVWTDAVFSPDLEGISGTLFSKIDRYSKTIKGAMFVMFRNPIEREISKYYAIKAASRQPGQQPLKLSLSDYIDSEAYSGNLMVRQLSGVMNPGVNVTLDHLLVAKEVLRRKCFIGLLEQKQETWRRIQKIFHTRWKLDYKHVEPVCEDRYLNWGWRSRNPVKVSIDMTVEDEILASHEGIIDIKTYKKIAAKNQLDLLLYEYSKYLFLLQKSLLPGEKPTVKTKETKANSTETKT
ncbi:hypothetical protein CTEN210_15749 [Chaetoceros tenuissimus]|uniref:Uncharacterized protein n=1 Tax=Chaetoceros tenuissimus TaxID=426638 RepID=A0AAD3D7J3_9STRA|nr:hypothetical protein CTEN210_15749 [Chaetoceros tenuissimus]